MCDACDQGRSTPASQKPPHHPQKTAQINNFNHIREEIEGIKRGRKAPIRESPCLLKPLQSETI
jgi:hypothetical protein